MVFLAAVVTGSTCTESGVASLSSTCLPCLGLLVKVAMMFLAAVGPGSTCTESGVVSLSCTCLPCPLRGLLTEGPWICW